MNCGDSTLVATVNKGHVIVHICYQQGSTCKHRSISAGILRPSLKIKWYIRHIKSILKIKCLLIGRCLYLRSHISTCKRAESRSSVNFGNRGVGLRSSAYRHSPLKQKLVQATRHKCTNPICSTWAPAEQHGALDTLPATVTSADMLISLRLHVIMLLGSHSGSEWELLFPAAFTDWPFLCS